MVHKPRISQLLRNAGLANTKADALELLTAGKVLVNGAPVFSPDFQANPKKERIEVNGMRLSLGLPKKYYIINKPAGCLTSKKRSDGRKYVMELLPVDRNLRNSLFPVGRLDYRTTGLLLITNDGALAHRILRPTGAIEKEYRVLAKGALTAEAIKALERGVVIGVDGRPYRTLPAKLTITERTAQTSRLQITITEGKKRQVRLMLAALGHPVLQLQRVRIGNVKLGNLADGCYRELTKEEAAGFLEGGGAAQEVRGRRHAVAAAFPKKPAQRAAAPGT